MQGIKPKRRHLLWQGVMAIALLVGVMALAACGGGGTTGGGTATSPGGAAGGTTGGASSSASGGAAGGGMAGTVNMTDDLKFAPADVSISKGGTVTWKNTGATVHTATADPSKASSPADASLPAGAKAWDSGDVQPGGSFSHTFDTAGTYKYFCTPHESAGMVGTITVK